MRNQTSFRPGASGNPGGKPAIADVSALARRYTPDWVRGLVGVVRLPVCRENAPSIVSAARLLSEVGYPGLNKTQPDAGSTNLHLHYLAVAPGGAAGGRSAAGLAGLDDGTRASLPADGPLPLIEATAEAWQGDVREPVLEEAYLPPVDWALPHEALPLWDAAAAMDGPLPSDGADNDDTGEKGETDVA